MKKPTEMVQLKLRFSERLRGRLEKAASKSEESMNSEIIRRLEQSFAAEEKIADFRAFLEKEWGHDIYKLAQSAANAIRMVEAHTGKRWVEDQRTFDLFTRTLLQLAQNYRDLILRNARERPQARSWDTTTSNEELAEIFADLSGISPPHVRKYRDAEHELADKRDSLEGFRKRIANARPLAQEDAEKEGGDR